MQYLTISLLNLWDSVVFHLFHLFLSLFHLFQTFQIVVVLKTQTYRGKVVECPTLRRGIKGRSGYYKMERRSVLYVTGLLHVGILVVTNEDRSVHRPGTVTGFKIGSQLA